MTCAARNTYSQPSQQPPKALAVRVTTAPKIDGVLSDAAWARASFLTEFRQQQPVENGAPSVRTEVAFAYDDDAFYVAARMFMAGPEDVQAVATRRDDTGTAERIIISLDTFDDRRTAYSFAVTAAGVRADWFHADDTSWNRDPSFDPVWEAEIQRNADSWTAEMRIPFSQLRFRSAPQQHWGVNINRYIPHRNEDLFWVVVPKQETAWSSRFGRLEGIRDLKLPYRLELRPYLAGDMTWRSSDFIEPGDPFTDQLDFGGRAGLDAKLGLGPSLTLDTTINPDFGQVEADPAVVNLSAFETSFAERRPFFVEGNQMLTGTGPAYYYSRRIGSAPRGETEADFVDQPDATRILGAAKLTGRLPSRLSIGALSAMTQRVAADTFTTETGRRSRLLLEPLASYNLMRVEQEFGAHSSKVGATLTGVYRDFDRRSLAAEQFNRWATTGGADWNLRLDEARYELTGAAGFSAVGGEAAAMTALQKKSAHYFQRPDQDHVRLDPNARSLLGWMARVGGGKRSGALTWNASSYAESPGFELNDLGLFQAGDDIGTTALVNYQNTEPNPWLHSWRLGLDGLQEWNFGGSRAPAMTNLTGALTFPNFWELSGLLGARTPGLDDAITRGGPLMSLGWATTGSMNLTNAYSSRTRWGLTLAWDASETGATGMTYSGTFSVQPLNRVQLSLSPRYLHRSDNRQYIETVEDAGGSTFGNRYLFSTVDRREFALQARVQFALSPNLVAEVYAEPFSSSGYFRDFGELAAASSQDVRRYGAVDTSIQKVGDSYVIVDGANSFEIDDPDFTVLSLRSTMVVRWEFLPGSTLFAVWQQDRSNEFDFADARGQVGRIFSTPGRQVFAVKLVYWWAS